MAIQYPKHEHITLGSVEGWGSDLNILRDPPKSITTRRIDKVGETSDITRTIDSSTDRANEAISLYARGVNPMVSVSYGNYGGNGGQMGDITSNRWRSQPRYPYPVMEGGAFRPPVRGPRDLLPLSRLPRGAIANVASGIDMPDYSKTSQYVGDLRAIKDVLNAYDIIPNKKGNISKNLVENFKMDNAINNKHINVDVSSGIRSMDISSYTRDNVDIYKGVNDDALSAFASSNLARGDGVQTLENFQIDENRYIQDALPHEAFTNLSKETVQGLSDVKMNTEKFVQDHVSYDAYTNMSKETVQNLSQIDFDTSKYIQDDLIVETFTNLSRDIQAKPINELVDNGRVNVKENMIQYERNAGVKPNRTFLNEIAQHNPQLEMRNPTFGVVAQKSDSTVYKRIDHQNELKYERNRPMPSVSANITKLEDFNSINLSSRTVRLAPSLQKGSFINDGVRPTTQRQNMAVSRETEKDRIRNKFNAQQFDRFNH